ncbi:MAG: metal-dependent hydrolase [Candidatus Obscuribacterales bacterium]|nr:metal-dependent hydrolase [Steroidobacteraceae bacterium]
MVAPATPADLTITPRDMKFNRTGSPASQNTGNHTRWWHGNDPVKTAFLNALSVTFPQGESLFIEAVRRYRDVADPKLKEQISAFIKQETLHTREHVVFNRLIEQAGYDTTAMNAYTAKRMALARARPHIAQLAVTVALEHFTAILAHGLLANPKHLDGAPPDVARLWQYHAIEEIEHKGVAFDTYNTATKDWSGFKRWYVRCKVMAIMSYLFWRSNARHMADFFRQDGINTPRTWLRVLKFHFVEPGMLRAIFGEYWKFYSLSFHPWNTDDRALIAAVEQELKETRAAA